MKARCGLLSTSLLNDVAALTSRSCFEPRERDHMIAYAGSKHAHTHLLQFSCHHFNGFP